MSPIGAADPRAIEWIVLGTGSAAAIVYGVRRYRPARIGPWLLLGGAIVASAAGDVLTALNRPGTAEVCFYAMFVLVACGLLQLTRVGAILVDRARLIDLLAFACSTLLVVWVFVIGDGGQIGNDIPRVSWSWDSWFYAADRVVGWSLSFSFGVSMPSELCRRCRLWKISR